jgi:uncharacterized zinc-type alcohol dehydrogenase-like protein
MKINGYATLKPAQTLFPFHYEKPPLKPFEILVKISHCGLCHTDLYMMENGWNRSSYPLLPGHEIVGIIVEKGDLAVLDLGSRVGVGWVHSSCLRCHECENGDTNICLHKSSIYNQGRFGGFASFVVADSRFSYLIPENIDSAHAAPLLCAGTTVYAPLVSHQMKKGNSIGIIGIGGLGHLAIQFANAFGAEVSAISSTPSKKKDAFSLGASHFFTDFDPPKPMSFDLILCTIDADINWNQILSYLRPNGVLCLVSRPSKPIVFDSSLLVSTQRTICGSNNANKKITEEMFDFAALHQIRPWIEEMPLSQINEGIEKLRTNKVRYRIVFHMNDENSLVDLN